MKRHSKRARARLRAYQLRNTFICHPGTRAFIFGFDACWNSILIGALKPTVWLTGKTCKYTGDA